jgi:hypothetical protein
MPREHHSRNTQRTTPLRSQGASQPLRPIEIRQAPRSEQAPQAHQLPHLPLRPKDPCSEWLKLFNRFTEGFREAHKSEEFDLEILDMCVGQNTPFYRDVISPNENPRKSFQSLKPFPREKDGIPPRKAQTINQEQGVRLLEELARAMYDHNWVNELELWRIVGMRRGDSTKHKPYFEWFRERVCDFVALPQLY